MTNEDTIKEKCGLEFLMEEIPRIYGAIDGLQGGMNEARNRSVESLEVMRNGMQKIGGVMRVIEHAAYKRLK
jgi:hypothetical protein